MSDRLFEYNKTYSEDDILKVATPVNHQGEYLIADSPNIEYWFIRDGHFWKLDHTWGHFIIGKRRGEFPKGE